MSRDRCKTWVPLMWSGGCSSDAPFLPSILQPVNPKCPSTPQLPSLLPFHLSASSLPSPPKSTLLPKEVHCVPAQVSKGVCCSSCCPATSKVLISITSHKKYLLNSGLPAFLQVAGMLHLLFKPRLHPSVLHLFPARLESWPSFFASVS